MIAKHIAQQDERTVSTEVVPISPGSSLTTLVANVGVPTQVANPSRASWRTFAQAVVPFLLVLNVALPIIQSFLVENIAQAQQVLGPIYGYVVIGVNFAAIVVALGSKLIALLMANPTVNGWIKTHLSWLAPIPVQVVK